MHDTQATAILGWQPAYFSRNWRPASVIHEKYASPPYLSLIIPERFSHFMRFQALPRDPIGRAKSSIILERIALEPTSKCARHELQPFSDVEWLL